MLAKKAETQCGKCPSLELTQFLATALHSFLLALPKALMLLLMLFNVTNCLRIGVFAQ